MVFGTCTALIALLPARRATAATIRGWDLGLMLAVAVLVGLAGLDGAGAAGPLAALVVVLAVAAVVVLVCFLRAAVPGRRGRAGNRSVPGVTRRVTPSLSHQTRRSCSLPEAGSLIQASV